MSSNVTATAFGRTPMSQLQGASHGALLQAQLAKLRIRAATALLPRDTAISKMALRQRTANVFTQANRNVTPPFSQALGPVSGQRGFATSAPVDLSLTPTPAQQDVFEGLSKLPGETRSAENLRQLTIDYVETDLRAILTDSWDKENTLKSGQAETELNALIASFVAGIRNPQGNPDAAASNLEFAAQALKRNLVMNAGTANAQSFGPTNGTQSVVEVDIPSTGGLLFSERPELSTPDQTPTQAVRPDAQRPSAQTPDVQRSEMTTTNAQDQFLQADHRWEAIQANKNALFYVVKLVAPDLLSKEKAQEREYTARASNLGVNLTDPDRLRTAGQFYADQNFAKHGGNFFGIYFSDALALAETLGRSIFVVAPNGDVREFKPSDPDRPDMGSPITLAANAEAIFVSLPDTASPAPQN